MDGTLDTITVATGVFLTWLLNLYGLGIGWVILIPTVCILIGLGVGKAIAENAKEGRKLTKLLVIFLWAVIVEVVGLVIVAAVQALE